MSVVYPNERGEPWAPKDSQCSLCGQDVTADRPAVCWGTPSETLLLHAACAVRLGTHLIMDGRECQLAIGEPWFWAQRAARAAGAALQAAEVRR